MSLPRKSLVLTLAMALGAVAPPVAAQSASPPAPDDCVVAPADDGGVALADGVVDPETLTEALDPCDGVLEPAPVGDADMTVPPPEGGETPVISPEALPPQPPRTD